MIAMLLLSIAILLFAKIRHEKISLFPAKFGTPYIIATALFGVIFIITLLLSFHERHSVMLLIYGSVVVPLFEELIFRGYVWNKLDSLLPKPWMTYIVTTLLFAIWHLGYIDSISLRVNTGLAHIMMWKAITGGMFGLLLGALRLKTKNCYSSLLLHGFLNMFGR